MFESIFNMTSTDEHGSNMIYAIFLESLGILWNWKYAPSEVMQKAANKFNTMMTMKNHTLRMAAFRVYETIKGTIQEAQFILLLSSEAKVVITSEINKRN